MSYLFTLSPDVNTLKALGYEPELVPGQKPEDALRVNYASRLYDKDKADKLSRKYDSIMLKYGLREEADTLFFIVLSEFEQAFHRLSSIIGMKDGLYGKPFTKG